MYLPLNESQSMIFTPLSPANVTLWCISFNYPIFVILAFIPSTITIFYIFTFTNIIIQIILELKFERNYGY